jgi:hypothetical protein
LGNGLLNDGLGNQWAIVTNGGAPTLEQFGAVTSQSLGGADTVADSYAIFIAMLGWCANNFYLGSVELGSGYYRLSQTLYVNQQLIFNGKGKNESYFHATHTTGAVIRFGAENSGLRNAGVTSSAARRAAAYSATEIGILFEGDDVPEAAAGAPRLLNCILENYYVGAQPSSGVHVVGPAFTGSLNGPQIAGPKGHGISFDRGELTNRVNVITGVISGICNIIDGRISNCGGHTLACGSPTSAYSTPALRVVMNNVEGGLVASDPAVRFSNTAVYLRGANHVLENCGVKCFDDGGSIAFVAGRNIFLNNNRCLGGYSNAYVIGTYDELPTDGIFINGFSVVTPLASLDPAVLVTLPAGETIEPKNIHINQGEDANITSIAGTDATMGSGDYRRVPRLFVNGQRPIAYKTSNQIVNNNSTPAEDTELKIWLAPFEKVMFSITVEYTGNSAADLKTQVFGPSGSTITYAPSSSSLKIGTADTVQIQGVDSGNLTFGAVATPRVCKIIGRCLGASSGGYVVFRWSQSSANASDTTVYSGLSHMQITNIIT